MVINIGMVKEKDYDGVLAEIREIKEACRGKLLKVIIETCLLTEEEKLELCRVVTESGAEYIKTSTGFSTGGATFEDVALMRKHVGSGVKVREEYSLSTFFHNPVDSRIILLYNCIKQLIQQYNDTDGRIQQTETDCFQEENEVKKWNGKLQTTGLSGCSFQNSFLPR